MRIRIRHETAYAYSRPIELSAQAIRMTPRPYDGQQVVRWSVFEQGRGPLVDTEDGYGNIVNTLTLLRDHQHATVVAEGEVVTTDMAGVVSGAVERLPLLFFLRATPRTAPDAAIEALARESSASAPLDRLHDLMERARKRVRYEVGTTHSATTAAEALAAGAGVCQDHAHLFIAGARLLGIPARYVSGYLWDPTAPAELVASHAWAEAHVDGLGWVGFDVANAICPTDHHVRVAVGLDYDAAAPIRGMWRGQAEESLAVRVRVSQIGAQQQ